MTDISTGVGFSLSSAGYVVEDTFWIWMEQELIIETATKKELADLIDDLFESDPCIEEERQELEIPEEEAFEEAVQVHFDMNMCNIDGAANYKAKVRVYRSRVNEPYTPRFTNGQLNSTKVVKEEVEGSLVVEDEAGTLLQYPVIGEPELYWNSTPIGKDGVGRSLPITRDGNALNWGKNVTGSIYYKYTTQYDVMDVTVFGTTEEEIGDCTVIAFYKGFYYELALTPPDDETETQLRLKEKFCNPNIRVRIDPDGDDVTCFIDVREEWLCQCSEEEAYHKDYERDIACPEGTKCGAASIPAHVCRKRLYSKTEFGGYTYCQGDKDDVHSREFYKETCCQYPPWGEGLPRCRETKSVVRAGTAGGLSREKVKEYTDNHAKVKFIPVWPVDGICGIHTVIQDVDAVNCCEGVVQLEYDYDHSVDVILSSGIVYVTGGKAPFFWQAGGDLTFAAGSTEVTTNARAMRVYTSSDACGTYHLYIKDACGQSVNGRVRANNGYWEMIENTIQDIYFHASCVKGGMRYVDDWCPAPASNCTGNGTDYCNDPFKGEAPDPVRVEGNSIYQWSCEE